MSIPDSLSLNQWEELQTFNLLTQNQLCITISVQPNSFAILYA
jgi:hypothetical protein